MTLDPQNPMTRRRILSGVVVAGAAAPILAACGGDEPTAAPTTEETPAPEDSASETPAPEESASETPAEEGDGGSGGEAVAKTADVPVGGGTVNKEAHVVVTQPAEGTFKGFTSICTHKQCDVSAVANGTINCMCHQSKYSIEDGSVQSGPAPAPLAAIAVKADGANIVKA